MGYGFETPKLPCAGVNHHRWRCEKKGRYCESNPVGLGKPLQSDFCSHCQVTLEQLEATE